jgi:hypothetical protein
LAYFSQNPCIQQENSSNISFICIGLRFFQEALSSLLITTFSCPTVGSQIVHKPEVYNDYSHWPLLQMDRSRTGQSPYQGPQTNTIKWSVQIGAWVSAVVIGTDGTELWKLDIGHFQDPGGGIDLGEIDVATALAPDGTLYFGHSGGPTPEHIFVIAD